MKMPIDVLREEIQKSGAISFARFMEAALYCPETGYYESNKDNVGHAGDFITSVSVGELFGHLLAFQFAEWLERLPPAQGRWRIMEAGAHDGKLAHDILAWLQIHRPELFSQIEYAIIEPSARRKVWQQERLAEFSNVRWLSEIPDAAAPRLNGILFGNELLDAFPIHRFGWDARKKCWFEWGVTCKGERLVWTKLAGSASGGGPCDLPEELLAVLPDNYTVETAPAAENWWRKAAGLLGAGKLVAIDYGFTEEERISPSRQNGTLRAYYRHRVSDDVLANVGEQDLTAHVNFSAIQKIGEAAGWQTDSFSPQSQWLTRIIEKALKHPAAFGEFGPKQIRQFQMLTHPEHLGRAFRVLIQSR